MTQEITKQSVALHDTDREIVNAVKIRLGLNFSSALRYIVRDWNAKQAQAKKTKNTSPTTR